MKKAVKISFASMCAILVAGCLFLMGCTPSKKGDLKIADTFLCHDTVRLKATDSMVVKESFGMWNWRASDDHIVFCTSGNDSIIRIYPYFRQAPFVPYGRTGRSADEFISYNWCQVSTADFCLYDIMNKRMRMFDIKGGKVMLQRSYPLPTDQDGLALPYTKGCQYKGPLFLMKEDGRSTNLCLANLEKGKVLSSYRCQLRDSTGKEPYTPYDYDIAVVGNTVCLCYHYMGRVEFVKIEKDKAFSPIGYIGENSHKIQAKNYDDLPYSFINVVGGQGKFFCLKSDQGKDVGHEVYVFDEHGDFIQVYELDHNVNSIAMGKGSSLLGYAEKESGAVVIAYKM